MARVWISWAPSPGATGYNIYAGPAPNTYTYPGSPKDAGNTTIGFIDVPNGQSYFVIRAYDAGGLGPPTPEFSGNFNEAPTGVVVIAGQPPILRRGTVLQPRSALRGG